MSIDLFKMFNDGQRIRRQDILRRFSTSEQFTGDYWVDGKKIYQRTWSVGARSGNSTATISLSSANIDQIWFDMCNSYYIESGGASDTGNRWPINANFGDPNASGLRSMVEDLGIHLAINNFTGTSQNQGVKMRILLLDTPKRRYYEWQYNCLI